MNASPSHRSCDNVQLDVVLFGDESSAEFLESLDHVEQCPRCQERLSQAASDDDLDEMVTILRQQPADSRFSLASAVRPSDLGKLPHHSPRQIKLDFLEPPSHPEMLGRLGRYEIEQVIGAGGMGIVLKGFDTELHRPVAIKVLAPHLAHNGAARQRFAREARSAASIVHPHVVAIHDVQSEQEAPYLVMEYVPGWSLQDRVEQEGPLAAAEILRIGMQAAAGLAAAHHQGVIHRDVKPANILLEKGVERAMLTDFGLARAADDATLTHSGMIAGTPHYMSPEQACGAAADARSDLFSLGAVLYFMATGHPPFRAEQAMAILHRICNDRHRGVQSVNACIPDALADTIDRLLEKKPSRRFATAEEVQQSLADHLHQLQQPRTWRRRWPRRVRRRAGILLAIACTLLAVLGVGIFGFSHKASTPVAGTKVPAALAAQENEMDRQELRLPEIELANQFAATNQLLQLAESRPTPQSTVGRWNTDEWKSSLNSAAEEIARLEAHWTATTNLNSRFNFNLNEEHQP